MDFIPFFKCCSYIIFIDFVHMCAGMHVCVCAPSHTYHSIVRWLENNLCKSVLSFYHVGLREASTFTH